MKIQNAKQAEVTRAMLIKFRLALAYLEQPEYGRVHSITRRVLIASYREQIRELEAELTEWQNAQAPQTPV